MNNNVNVVCGCMYSNIDTYVLHNTNYVIWCAVKVLLYVLVCVRVENNRDVTSGSVRSNEWANITGGESSRVSSIVNIICVSY
jgi:hypothetical protein